MMNVRTSPRGYDTRRSFKVDDSRESLDKMGRRKKLKE